MYRIIACALVGLLCVTSTLAEGDNACIDEEGNRKCDDTGEPSRGCWFVDSPFMNPETGEDCCPWEVCGRDCYDEMTGDTVAAGTRFATVAEGEQPARDCTCVPNQDTGDSHLECVA